MPKLREVKMTLAPDDENTGERHATITCTVTQEEVDELVSVFGMTEEYIDDADPEEHRKMAYEMGWQYFKGTM